MRTTVEIDADLMKELRARGYHEGQSLRKVLNAALRRGLTPSAAPPLSRRYTCPAIPMGQPMGPTIDLDKALALAGAIEDVEIIRELELRK